MISKITSLSVIADPSTTTSSSQWLIHAGFFLTRWVWTFIIRVFFSAFMGDLFVTGWTSWWYVSLWKTSTVFLWMEPLWLLRNGENASCCPGFFQLLKTFVQRRTLMALSFSQQHLMCCLIPYWQLHLCLSMIHKSPCCPLTSINILVLIACLQLMCLSLCLVIWVSGLLVLQGKNSRNCCVMFSPLSIVSIAPAHLPRLRDHTWAV